MDVTVSELLLTHNYTGREPKRTNCSVHPLKHQTDVDNLSKHKNDAFIQEGSKDLQTHHAGAPPESFSWGGRVCVGGGGGAGSTGVAPKHRIPEIVLNYFV